MHLLAALLPALSQLPTDPPPADQTIARLVQNLADDYARFNANDAINDLRQIGAAAIPALEGALESQDWQQRQSAAAVLQSIRNYTPSPHMIRVCIEGLRNDALPDEDRADRAPAYTHVFNAADGIRFLAAHVQDATTELHKGMESDDLQQRFLCAAALGWGGRIEALPRAAEILVPHLKDNRIPCDGLLAACALYHFGPQAIPVLTAARQHAVDRQQRELLDLVLLDLKDPPKTNADFGKRKGIQSAMRGEYDPIAWLTLDVIPMSWGHLMTEECRDRPPAADKKSVQPASPD